MGRARGPGDEWLAERGWQPRTLKSRGGSVRYVVAGEGAPVLFIHGFAASMYTWRHTLAALASRFRVAALDLPACGGSDVRPSLQADDLRAAVFAVLDALEMKRAHLVGHSLGGGLAAWIAGRDPERVDRLALVDAAGLDPRRSARPAIVRLAGLGPAVALAEHLTLRPFVRAALRQVFHDPSRVSAADVDEYLRPLARPGVLQAWRSLLSADGPPEPLARVAPDIAAPTLVIWGAADTWVPVAQAERWAAAIRRSRLALLDDCGHIPQEERPEQFASKLRRFLAGSPGTARVRRASAAGDAVTA